MIQYPVSGLALFQSSLQQALQTDMLDTIAAHIRKGTVVILKNAIPAERALHLRDSIVAWRNQREVVSFSVNTNAPGINFHRIDAHPEKSQLPHIFHQHGFGQTNSLTPDFSSELLAVANPMLNLQNAVAHTRYSFSMPEVRIKALQYPCGGGFLMKHTHPIDPQGVGLILALSKSGSDFGKGGTTFVTPAGFVDTSAWHDAGDLILFRYDLEHAVGPVDSDSVLDWNSDKGRWTLVLELLSTHNRSEAA
ncbi:MAG TPA: hypothetical protein VFX11_02615 [Candidatus Kapabacteria bacterium]|nr:hypothetical protein [Candidatus Kapabacteria bacterium]